jgi:tetratricopeptide (TPR) repeat protein
MRFVPWLSDLPGARRMTAISLADYTTAARVLLWSIAWQGFLAHPLTGWGPESFDTVFDRFYNPAMVAVEPWYDSPHNLLLEWLVAGGAPALLLLLALFFLVARAFIRADWLDPYVRAVMLGLLAAYGLYCLVGLNDLHGSIVFVTIAAFAQALAGERPHPETDIQVVSDRAMLLALSPLAAAAMAAAYVINAPGLANAAGLLRAMMIADPATGAAKAPATQLAEFERVLAGAPLGREEATFQLLEFAFYLGTRPEGSVDAPSMRATYDAAHAAATRRIAERPQDARLEYLFGVFLNRFGQGAEAARHLVRASLLAPYKQIILVELGINTYLRAHDSLAALPVLRRAFELEPRYIPARLGFALALYLTGQDVSAEGALAEDVSNLNPQARSDVLRAYARALDELELRLAWQAADPEMRKALAALRSRAERSLGALPR